MKKLAIFQIIKTKQHKDKLRTRDKILTKELEFLRNRSSFVPIDKASGNVAFVCQRHYA